MQEQRIIPTGTHNLNMTMERILDLEDEEYDVDDGETRPAEETVRAAGDVLTRAFRLMRGEFPLGYASTTGRGDVRVYWEEGNRRVHLIVPANSNGMSLYHRDGECSQLASHVTAADLADRLIWLCRS